MRQALPVAAAGEDVPTDDLLVRLAQTFGEQFRQDLREGEAGVRRRHAAMAEWPGRAELTVRERADRFHQELAGVLRWAS